MFFPLSWKHGPLKNPNLPFFEKDLEIQNPVPQKQHMLFLSSKSQLETLLFCWEVLVRKPSIFSLLRSPESPQSREYGPNTDCSINPNPVVFPNTKTVSSVKVSYENLLFFGVPAVKGIISSSHRIAEKLETHGSARDNDASPYSNLVFSVTSGSIFSP